MSKGRRGYKQKKPFRPGQQATYWQTEAYNQQLFNMFQNDLIELALSRFRWVGLPETCNERYLEWVLLTEGSATLAYPSLTSETLLSLKSVQQGAPNMYDEPRSWRALGATGKTNFMCNWTNGVWIWENSTRYPLMVKINIWARELADIMRTKQINRDHARARARVHRGQAASRVVEHVGCDLPRVGHRLHAIQGRAHDRGRG